MYPKAKCNGPVLLQARCPATALLGDLLAFSFFLSSFCFAEEEEKSSQAFIQK